MFAWEQLGGRLKLVDEALAVPCKPTAAAEWRAEEKRRALAAERREAKQTSREWCLVEQFLQQHRFRHVNQVKVTWFGIRSYPLRTAVKDCDWQMARLLLQFGARDISGY